MPGLKRTQNNNRQKLILFPGIYPQNLIVSCVVYIPRIPTEFHEFLSNLGNLATDKQTDRQTDRRTNKPISENIPRIPTEFHEFLSNLGNLATDKQTDRQTDERTNQLVKTFLPSSAEVTRRMATANKTCVSGKN